MNTDRNHSLAQEMDGYFEKYPGPVLYLDKNAKVLSANKEARFFFKRDPVTGLSWLDLCRELSKENWQSLLNGGPALQIESDIGGERIYLFTHVYANSGNGVIVSGTDVSQWKDAEKKIREQQTTIREMARFPDMNPGPVLRMDLNGNILLSNEAATNTFGKDLLNKNWKGLCPQITDEIWSHIQSSDSVIPVEISIGKKTFVFHHRMDKLTNLVFVYGTDISLNKLNEKKLEEQKISLAAMARFPDMNPGPVIRMGMDGKIILSNIAAQNLFGENITGHSWLQICPAMDINKWNEILRSEKVYPYEIQIGERDFVFNHRRDFELNLVFVFGTDVTLQKLAEKQLRHSEKMASLGELTAGIAHEIQNPLNFVNNFSEVSHELIDEMKTELDIGDTNEAKNIANEVKQNLEKILHHGKRADGIVKGMLQHSRTSSGQKEPTDINALAGEYLRLAYHGLRARDKSFQAKFESDFDNCIGSINIIPQDIGRVILNLINNAFYAVDEKKKKISDGYEPTVSVSTKRSNGKIEIRVKDNGNGIPKKILDKIFQPFFTTKPTGQGTGLGLSLSYDIVKAHGGELKVETKEGKGSEFIIQLPY